MGPIAWPRDFPTEMFPTAMIHAHEQEILRSRVLTTDQWADYLIYLHPEQKVFVDGRSDFYGPEIGNQFLHLMAGAPGWQEVIEKYRFNFSADPCGCRVGATFEARAGVAVAADDGKHILLVLGGHAAVLTTAKAGSPEPRF